ncbi:tyrosine-type recombinase/integrase [Luteimonas sp. A534]
MPLTDAKVRNAKPLKRRYKLADGHGLYLLVQPTGSRLWRYKYRLNGQEQLFAIGRYPEVSLLEARSARAAAYQLVSGGVHPTQHRRAGKLLASHEAATTFKAVSEEWIAANKNWKPYYRGQVATVLKNDVFPAIGDLPIKDVTAAHLLSVVTKVMERPAPSIAALIQMWSSQIFRYAIRTRGLKADPASALRGVVVRPPTKHKKALKKAELTEFLSKLDRSAGEPHVRIALELLMHTFVRPVELRCASWSEFDLAHRQWHIPGARMKKGHEHIVPLSEQVVALLEELRQIHSGAGLLFRNQRDPKRPMSATTLNRRIERMGYAGKFSAHGFRATASTHLNESGWRADLIERQLAHQERNASRRPYNHAEYLKERTDMMQSWSNFIDGYRLNGRKAAAS